MTKDRPSPDAPSTSFTVAVAALTLAVGVTVASWLGWITPAGRASTDAPTPIPASAPPVAPASAAGPVLLVPIAPVAPAPVAAPAVPALILAAAPQAEPDDDEGDDD